jgi:2-hydroxychromene-2-carboxylate isomerase
VRFFFGAMSPYSWFAAERIDGLIDGVEWHPVLAGAVFKAHGRIAWGLTERRAAGIADCEARARQHGLGPIRWPEPWPTSDLFVGRAMIFARARGKLRPFALAAMRAAFLEGLDLGELAAVRTVAERVGLDPDDVAAAVHDPEIKQAVRAATQEAIDLGVFGVPTVAVGGRLLWGDDRLAEAAALAAAGR